MKKRVLRKYEKTFKMNAIEKYRAGGRTCPELAREMGIPIPTLNEWVRVFKKANQLDKKYTPAFKLNIIKQRLEGGRKYAELAQESGVHKRTLNIWVTAYQKNQNSVPQAGIEKKSSAVEETLEQLRKELAIACAERHILKQALRILSAQ